MLWEAFYPGFSKPLLERESEILAGDPSTQNAGVESGNQRLKTRQNEVHRIGTIGGRGRVNCVEKLEV